MKTPKISVIIPVYNAEKYLSETIKSVITQSWENLEVIIINDGSKDNSLEVINKYKETDKRIIAINQENLGQCAASNTGIKKATGEYFKFLDADDILSENHIEIQLKTLNNETDYIASCEWGRFFDGNPVSAKFNPEPVWKDMEPLNWIKTALNQRAEMMGGWLWLIPKQILNKAGMWDERLSLNNDFDFSVRVLLASKGVKFAKGARLYYRSGLNNSLSRTISEKACQSALLSNELGFKKIFELENSELTRKLCANRYQDWLYRIFPEHPEYIKESEKRIRELGGSTSICEGGKVFIILKNIFGWKIAKRIQRFIYKLFYK